MHSTVHDGIRFYEGTPKACQLLRPVRIEIGGMFRQAQLKTLRDVKQRMAQEARRAGGNAIVGFEYGQQSVGCLRSILQLDDVNWYGRGTIARMRDTP